MPAADPSSCTRHGSPQPEPRCSSIRYRPLRRVLRKPSDQTLRSTRVVTPKRSRSGILKSVDYDVHSTSPPQRGPVTLSSKPTAVRQKKTKIRVIPEVMSRNRSPSLTSNIIAYELDGEDAAESCPSPVIGDTRRHNEHLSTRYTKLPSLQESRDWRRSIEARLWNKSGDVSEDLLPQQPHTASRRDNGPTTPKAVTKDVLMQTNSFDDLAPQSGDAGSILVAHSLCGMPSMPSFSGLRPRHSMKHNLAATKWLYRASDKGHALTTQSDESEKHNSPKKCASIPRQMRSKLVGRSLRGTGATAKKSESPKNPDKTLEATSQIQDAYAREGPELWQTEQGVRGFHRESMNFSDFRGEVEKGLQSAVLIEPVPTQQDHANGAPNPGPAFEKTGHKSVESYTPIGSLIEEESVAEHRGERRQSTARIIGADDRGSPRVQSGQIRTPVGNPAMPTIRIVDVEKASAAESPPLPGPRSSSKSAMGILGMPLEQFGRASSSIAQDSPVHNNAYVSLNHTSNLRRQAAGLNLRSNMSSTASSMRAPTYGAPAAASTDTLTMIEAQAQGSRMISLSAESLPLDPPVVAVRNSKPLGNPPERPLPELPAENDQMSTDITSVPSSRSARSQRYSRAAGSTSFRNSKSGSISSSVVNRAFNTEDKMATASRDRNLTHFIGDGDLSRKFAVANEAATSETLALRPVVAPFELGMSRDLNSPTSIYSQDSLKSNQSYPRPLRTRFSGRADRVRALKKRDLASTIHSTESTHNHYRHHRRISEEDENEAESTDPLDKFPTVPASQLASASRSRSRAHSRHRSRPQSQASQSQRHSWTYSASRHAEVNKLTHHVLAQSNIMVWADTNPITATFQAGAISSSPSIASKSRSPGRIERTVIGKESRCSIRSLGAAPALPKIDYPQLGTGAHTPPSSASSVAGDVDDPAPGIVVGISSPVKRDSSMHDEQQARQPPLLSPQRRANAAAPCVAKSSTSGSLEKLNISSEIEKIETYLLQLESDRSTQKRKIEQLERMLAMALRREYWVDTRASDSGNGKLNGNPLRWRGVAMNQGQDRNDLGRRQIPLLPSATGVGVWGSAPRPISDASQISTTPSLSTGASLETETSTASSNHGDWMAPEVVVSNDAPDQQSKRISGTSMANIDAMLRELHLSKNVGSLGVAEIPGHGLARSAVRRDEKGLVMEGW